MTLRRLCAVLAVTASVAVIAGALLAPYVWAEYLFNLRGGAPSPTAPPTVPVAGRWYDDYFLIETLDADTFATGEPRYYQGNYSYLILGTQRAVLFDAGTGLKDIVPVARSLTALPITVIPSHLHFDHVGALGRLDKTALIDSPSLRARIVDSKLTLQRYEFLGFADRLKPPTFRVDEWWAPDSIIDIGGRSLKVLATPGHTPTSVSLYEADRHLLFAGDFVYPSSLYAFLPGASRSAYLRTTRRLLSIVDPTTKILTAHMADATESVRAPVMGVADLKALERTLSDIDRGAANSRGFYPRVFPVKGPVEFDTGWAWDNR